MKTESGAATLNLIQKPIELEKIVSNMFVDHVSYHVNRCELDIFQEITAKQITMQLLFIS